jgi:hypothetical protein
MPCDEYEQQDAEEAMKKAEKILNTARDFNKYWFPGGDK